MDARLKKTYPTWNDFNFKTRQRNEFPRTQQDSRKDYFSRLCNKTSSGIGAWFVNTTQHLLMGYYKRCEFNKKRFSPTHMVTKPSKVHSRKPMNFYPYIEEISDEPRLEIFARYKRQGWDVMGDEIPKWEQRLLKP